MIPYRKWLFAVNHSDLDTGISRGIVDSSSLADRDAFKIDRTPGLARRTSNTSFTVSIVDGCESRACNTHLIYPIPDGFVKRTESVSLPCRYPGYVFQLTLFSFRVIDLICSQTYTLTDIGCEIIDKSL